MNEHIVDPPDTPIYRDPAAPRAPERPAYVPRAPVGLASRELDPGIYWSDVLHFDEFWRWARANSNHVEVLEIEPPETRPAAWWEEVGADGMVGEPMHWVRFRVGAPVQWYGFGSLSRTPAESRADTLQRPPPEDYRDAMRDLVRGTMEAAEDLAAAARQAPQAAKVLVVGAAVALGLAFLLRSRR